ncbi:major facilitator superfamily domain-containing protein [Aspergillus varians]
MRLLDGTSLTSYKSLSSDDDLDPASDDNDHEHAGFDVEDCSELTSVPATWTTTTLVFAYSMIWLVYLVEGTLSATAGILAPYVTSAFAQHSLTPTVGILSSVVGGVTNLTLAKVLDVFGRPQGCLFCIVLATTGLVAMTACSSVKAYAAAQVFQTVGNNGILYTVTVLVADTCSLRNQGLVQALVSSPYLFTFFLAGSVSAGCLNGPGWRWAFGAFAILVPSATLPLFSLMLKNHRKTKKRMLTPKATDNRNPLQSFIFHARQFDAIGLLLLSTGIALFLLPFNLYVLQGWSSLPVIGMLIIGTGLLTTFVIWEKYCAPNPFLPYSLLFNPTILGACILSAILFTSFWSWNSFFGSYLQVAHDLSITNASYVVQLYTVCSVLASIAVGALVHYTGRFKPVCLYLGIPISVLGPTLLLYICKTQSTASASTSVHIVPIIIAQILISLAAGTIMVADEVAILAAVSTSPPPSHHEPEPTTKPETDIAIPLAVLGVFGNIGAAVGLTIASAIWQRVFPASLAEHIPRDTGADLDAIYANLSTQLSFPVGSVTRMAIARAYGDALVWMLGVGSAVWVVGILAVGFWRDINVIKGKMDGGSVDSSIN